MKQVLQNLRDGRTIVAEVPAPAPRRGTALVLTAASLVSAGTERMVVEFAEKSLIGKAQSRPDLVRQILDKARREGLLTTIEAAFNRLDQPMQLGYSSAGTIIALGEGMEGFQIGERVACAGGGFAVHAEYNVVPKNLLVPISPEVDFESAAFTTLGAIALHGFRLARPQLGESVAVIGLGLLGLLAAGIARAAGCKVCGFDLNPDRIALANQMGATAMLRAGAEEAAQSFTHGRGFDVVLICADTPSNDPIELAGIIARDRAQVIALGAFGLDIPRKVYYEKELFFQVSRSYGPGRYDLAYEEGGQDYPMGFVRWTEGRNLESFAELLGSGQLDIRPLITHRFPIERAPEAYELITGKQKEPYLGILLTYPKSTSAVTSPLTRIAVNAALPGKPSQPLTPTVGVLGAGNYATAMFLPAVQKVGGAKLLGITSASGTSASHAAKKYGFEYASSVETDILENDKINTIVILTRHQHHARQIQAALKAGKNVYCEKPLAIKRADLEEITRLLTLPDCPLLAVGFNRRFAPLAIQLKGFLKDRSEPIFAHYRVNAGFLPDKHWLHDPIQGGGRIIGEGCHFVDFLTFLTGQAPQTVTATALPDYGKYHQDNVLLTFTYPDGSVGSVSYLANGDKSFPKERVEVFCGGQVAVLEDFRSLELVKGGSSRTIRTPLRQDKGHAASWAAFLQAIRQGGLPPIPYQELNGVTLATFAAVEALSSRSTISIQS
jgi:predicted dehydrogenase/threonine dehydrogenase-like Zn-dependent dehydrogenase